MHSERGAIDCAARAHPQLHDDADRRVEVGEDGVDAVMAKENLDALVAPTGGATWAIAATAGYPYITVPIGLRENTAVGMAFFGKAFSEPSLIKYAYAFEQMTKGRVTPKFIAQKPLPVAK